MPGPEVEKWVMGVREKMEEARWPSSCSSEGQCDVKEQVGREGRERGGGREVLLSWVKCHRKVHDSGDVGSAVLKGERKKGMREGILTKSGKEKRCMSS